ncbi:DUF4974 domain-containing protein [Puteibacter caeruleilacunae]|nr:DUF4974 domain-containing protein [Puteibacter caeruleilacunae]
MTRNNSEKKHSNSKEFNHMDTEEKILALSSNLVPPQGEAQQVALDSILNRIDESKSTKRLTIGRVVNIAAAVVLLLIGLQLVLSLGKTTEAVTRYAENSHVVLPDGSKVDLNADTKLKWNNKKFTKKRSLVLSGEAFFDVEKGAPFAISTRYGTVNVLGTQLNVYARNGNFWVSCITGKVSVSSQGKSVIITPGEKVQLTGTTLQKTVDPNIENTILWLDGQFHFEETSLGTIFEEIERQFDVKIIFKGDASRLVNVDFSNDKLTEALDIITIPMQLEYAIIDNQITIIDKR